MIYGNTIYSIVVSNYFVIAAIVVVLYAYMLHESRNRVNENIVNGFYAVTFGIVWPATLLVTLGYAIKEAVIYLYNTL